MRVGYESWTEYFRDSVLRHYALRSPSAAHDAIGGLQGSDSNTLIKPIVRPFESNCCYFQARQEQAPRVRHVILLLYGESNVAQIIGIQLMPYSQNHIVWCINFTPSFYCTDCTDKTMGSKGGPCVPVVDLSAFVLSTDIEERKKTARVLAELSS